MGINIDQEYSGDTMNAAYVKSLGAPLQLVIKGAERREFDDGSSKVVLLFSNHDKTLSLNVTNAKFISASLGSPDTDYWIGACIEVGTQVVTFGGKRVDGIMVTKAWRPSAPTAAPSAPPFAPAPPPPTASSSPPPPAPVAAPPATLDPAANKNSVWSFYSARKGNDPGPFYAAIAAVGQRAGLAESQFTPQHWNAVAQHFDLPQHMEGGGLPPGIPI